MYVMELDADNNVVTVGARDDIFKKEMIVNKINWLARPSNRGTFGVSTQIRHNHAAADSLVTPLGHDSARIEFAKPQFAITPGQAAVFYDGNQVLGGGWIGRRKNSARRMSG